MRTIRQCILPLFLAMTAVGSGCRRSVISSTGASVIVGEKKSEPSSTVPMPTDAARPTAVAQTYSHAFDPVHTWAYVLGVLSWNDANLSGFPTAGRKDLELANQLKADGVPADQVVFLADAQATLANIRATLPGFLRRAPPNSTLIFYFAGHGVRDHDHLVLTNSDIDTKHATLTGFTMAELRETLLREWHGNRAILLGDMCNSGGLSEVVDGLESAGRGIRAAAVTSANAQALSTGNWTFTESMIQVFKGDPVIDADRDGAIEFAEVDDYVHQTMRFRERQLTHASPGASFEHDWIFQSRVGDAVPASPDGIWHVGQYAESSYHGTWYIAQITDVNGALFKITYPGYNASWDEWVPATRLRVPVARPTPVGSKVETQSDGKWYPSTVVGSELEFTLVHYNGWGPEWDEYVAPNRIRTPTTNLQ